MKLVNLDDLEVEEVSHNPHIKKRVMLLTGDLGAVTIFAQAVFPPGETADEHSHRDMGEVFFIESGYGVIKVNGAKRDIGPGTCVAVTAGESHEIRNTGDVDLVVTYFGIRIT